MPSGEQHAKQTTEDKHNGATWSGDGTGAEEPVPVSHRRISNLVPDNKDSDAQPEIVGDGTDDRHEEDAHRCGESMKPTGCEPMDILGKSPPVDSANDARAGSAHAQDGISSNQARENGSSEASEVPGPSLEVEKETARPSGAAPPSQSGRAVKEMDKPRPSAHVSRSTRASTTKSSDSIVSEELLMAPTPEHILKEVRDGQAETKAPELRRPSSPDAKPTGHQHAESFYLQQTPNARNSDPSHEAMAGSKAPKPLVGMPLCEGDTTLTQNFLPPAVIDGLFERLCDEVHFKKMRHQGSEVPRFVAVQGTIDPDGTQPIYRHPSDESPPLAAFTPAVQMIRGHVERQLGHPVNHVLIQCYRNGSDYISEHSDKTLDIFRWSYIANVSIGAMRTMMFRTKRGDKKDGGAADRSHPSGSSTPLEAIDRAATKPVDILKDVQPAKRQTTRCPMPHNSLIKMGLVTNEKWLHGIKADKRPLSEKTAAELAWHGTRISLTFRYIVTFLSPVPESPVSPTASFFPGPRIWGQGAIAKTREHARPVLNGQTPEAIAMLRAFGRENNSPEFDWEANYGCGYDVLHMKAAPRYFGCGDDVVDGRVRIMLAECGVKYARGDIGIDKRQRRSLAGGVRGGAEVGEVLPVRFVVDDADRTTVVGDIAILLFLDAKHPRKRGSDSEVAGVYSRFYAAIALEQRWKSIWTSAPKSRRAFSWLKLHLTELEKWAAEAARQVDLELSIADYALWPVLHDVALAWKSLGRGQGAGHTVFGSLGLPALDGYYRKFAERSSVVGVFGVDVVASVLPEPRPAEDDESEEDDDEVENADKKPGKGKLPTLTEFGGGGL